MLVLVVVNILHSVLENVQYGVLFISFHFCAILMVLKFVYAETVGLKAFCSVRTVVFGLRMMFLGRELELVMFFARIDIVTLLDFNCVCEYFTNLSSLCINFLQSIQKFILQLCVCN